MTKLRKWSLGTGLVVVLVLIAGWFLLISPQRDEAAELKEQVSATEERNAQTESRIRQLSLEQKDLPAQQARLAELRQQLPALPQLPSLIRQLNADASLAGVVLSAISPSAPKAFEGADGVATIPLALTVSGTYAQNKQFLYQLEEQQRAIIVTNVALAPAGGENSAGRLQMQVSAFTFMTANIAPSAAGTATPTAEASPGATPTGTGPAATSSAFASASARAESAT